VLIGIKLRYQNLTSTHDATSSEIEALTANASQWRFEAEKKDNRIEVLEANLAELNVRGIFSLIPTTPHH
jgi:hypothetical protein